MVCRKCAKELSRGALKTHVCGELPAVPVVKAEKAEKAPVKIKKIKAEDVKN